MNDMQAAVAEIYQAMGYALAEWNATEDQLFRFFILHLNAPDPFMAMASLGAVQSLRGKLEVVTAVLERSYRTRPASLKAWDTMKERVLRLSSTRNRIAHGIIAQGNWLEKGALQEGVRLMPVGINLYNKAKGDKEEAAKMAMSAQDIFRAHQTFKALRGDLEAFESDHPPAP